MKQHQAARGCCTPPNQARLQHATPEQGPEDGEALYESQARHTPLLTAEQERELSRAIKIGGKAGRAALERFTAANQRLVWDRARRYQGRGLDWEDLVQEGNMGLLRAINRFDPDRGNKFSTMAIWWIDQALQRAIDDTGKTIRVPVHQQGILRRLRKEEMRLLEKLDRLPTNEELAEALDLPLSKVAALRQIPECAFSLSEPLTDGDELELGMTLADPGICVETEVLSAAFSAEVLAILEGTLSAREQHVLHLRYGLVDGRSRTLEEVGKTFRVTRERVRQIEEKALRKLRQSPQLRVLAAGI